MEKLVIVGNGMVPGRMLEELLANAPGRYDITVFNAEPRVNYDRVMLSPVLSGEKTFADIVIHDLDWYRNNGITLHLGQKVTTIDREARTVTSAGGITVDYDRLVIATGSRPFIPDLPGNALSGVVTYRDLDDVEAMLEIASRKGKAVVIGGGVLGLEAAYGLQRQGMDVTVVHIGANIMDKQLDPQSSRMLQKALEQREIDVITRASTRAILGAGSVTGVELTDGRVLEAELVVFAVGIRPSTALAAQSGLNVNRGIIVDDTMQTSDPAIFAIGECAEHRGVCYGLVAPLYESAAVLADRLAGGNAIYTGSVTNTRLKVTGISVFSAGDFATAPDRQDIVLGDQRKSVYKRLVLKDNRLIGAVLYGEAADGAWFFDLIRNKTDISAMRETLIFGQSYTENAELSPYGGRCSLTGDGAFSGYNNLYAQEKAARAANSATTQRIDRVERVDAIDAPRKTEPVIAARKPDFLARMGSGISFSLMDQLTAGAAPILVNLGIIDRAEVASIFSTSTNAKEHVVPASTENTALFSNEEDILSSSQNELTMSAHSICNSELTQIGDQTTEVLRDVSSFEPKLPSSGEFRFVQYLSYRTEDFASSVTYGTGENKRAKNTIGAEMALNYAKVFWRQATIEMAQA